MRALLSAANPVAWSQSWMGVQMKAAGILIRALLAMPLLLFEIDPGTSGGTDGHGNFDLDQRQLEQRHLAAADGEGRTN